MLEAGHRALQAADTQAAIDAFTAAVAAAPNDHAARYGLAAALMQAGEGSFEVLDDARTLEALSVMRGLGVDLQKLRSEPEYGFRVAVHLYDQQHMPVCASVAWSMALSRSQIDAQGLLNYALMLQHQGRVEEASQYLRVAVENFPSAGLHNFLVYDQLFCDDGEARHAAEAQAWASRWAKPSGAPLLHMNPPLAGRKLKLGYVAPRFAGSQLSQFVTPIFEGHDPESVEVFLYPREASTETAWPAWVKVRPIGALDDAAAAALIRADGVDVLNDLWGHTTGSRLGVFARKPAPVQVAWINFFQTTGLSQIDYVLHADGGPAFPGQFSEAIWPIGPVFTPYRPADGRLPPMPTPAKASGQVTLGSYNHPAKLSDEALATWATILRNAPNSRLVLKYRYYADPVLRSVTAARFAANGVGAERLVFQGHTSGEAYYGSFREIDLMLDCWPAPGSTTTMEALSNGVPVLTMVGDPPNVGGYYAQTVLRAAGLDDMVTSTPQAFVGKALDLVGDVEALDALRRRVRPGFDEGPICNEAEFVRRLEDEFRTMVARAQGRPALLASVGAG